MMQFSEHIPSYISINSGVDFALVFAIVYVLLKLVRGTRPILTAVGMVLLGLLYWLAVAQDLTMLEFVLQGTSLYIGVAVIVLFQTEIRQSLIYFGNRFMNK